MKKVLYALLLVMSVSLALPSEVRGQIGRSDWSYGLVLQSDNIVYNTAASLVEFLPLYIGAFAENDDMIRDYAHFYTKNSWWLPQIRYRANVVQKMEFNGADAKIYPNAWGYSGIDWGFNNYSIGYHLGWLSRLVPIGFDLEADYVQDGYKVKLPESDSKMTICKRMIAATALLKIRLMSYDKNRLNPVVEVGGSYHYAFHYKDDYINDKDAVNNGFTGIIGLGFTNTETHISWSLRYEHLVYDYYNKEFLFNGERIFSDSKTTFGRLGIAISFAF